MATKYKVELTPAHSREELISKAAKNPIGVAETYDVFPGKKIQLTKVHLPIGVPIYRMANGRTSIEQLQYIKSSRIGDQTFFAQGEEREDAQAAQHSILAALAREGSESVAVIFKILRDDQQTSPIWITPRGVVINGNRRLAAMRELFAEDSKTFARYGTVECAILPNLTPEQIEELEIRLQVAPETKLPYGWIHDCILIEKRLKTQRGEEYVANLLRRKPADVRAAMAALKEVDIYLREWRGAPGDYSLVEEGGKQFFYDLPKHLKGKTGVLLEATRRIGWILYDSGDDLGTRVYAYNKIIGEKAADVLIRLASREDVVLDEDAEGAGEVERGGESDLDLDLDVDLGVDTSAPEGDVKVLNALNDVGRREEVSAAVVAVCATMYEASKTSAQGESALKTLRDIQTRLQEIDLTKAAPETWSGISRQIHEILRLAADIQERNSRNLEHSSIGRAVKK